jgi:hypothetical protein
MLLLFLVVGQGDLAALLHGYFGDHVRAKQLYQQALIADPFHVRTMVRGVSRIR